jgi:superoxide dismutase
MKNYLQPSIKNKSTWSSLLLANKLATYCSANFSFNFSSVLTHHVLVSILRAKSVEPTTLDLSLLEDITNNFSTEQEIDTGVLVVIPTMKKLMG